MTIREQAKVVEAALQQWAKSSGARVFVAADELDCIEQFRLKPGKPSAAVLWQAEEPQGEHPEEGKVLRTFKIVMSRGRSLKLQPGESLTEGAAGGEAMLDLVEQGREVARGLRMEDQEGELQLPVYQGSGAFQVNGYLLDAIELRFGLYADIPMQSPNCEEDANAE